MRFRLLHIFLGVFLMSTASISQTIRINELVSSNSIHFDEDGDTPDWIELYNYGSEPINLSGYSLSDDDAIPDKWVIGNIALGPESYMLIWASGKSKITSASIHTNFKISSTGEDLTLYDKTGQVVHRIAAADLPPDISTGYPIGSSSLQFFSPPTPKAANTGVEQYRGIIRSVLDFSHDGGLLQETIDLEIRGKAADETIRYTTDGSLPTDDSEIYITPILIDTATVVRARIFRNDFIPSETISQSYLMDIEHNLPIVSLIVDPKDFFDEETGIYSYGHDYIDEIPFFGANFWNFQEKPIHVEFFDTTGYPTYSFDGGVKIFGGYSRANDQRSLSLFARKKYGADAFDYPFFSNRTYTTFQSLVLRNAGNDWLRSNFRDFLMTDILEGSELDLQATQPIVTYINGNYWGFYNLREKISEHYLASKNNVDPNTIDLLEKDGLVKFGSNEDYLELRSFFTDEDLTISANYEHILQKIDISNFIFYYASNIYFDNRDWPGNNVRYWRAPGRKWQWLFYDSDFGFSNWIPAGYRNNTLKFVLQDDGPNWPNPPWSSLLFRKLILNIDFKNAFVNRLADEMNTRFLPENLTHKIDSIRNYLGDELLSHIDRWGGSPALFNEQMTWLYRFANLRTQHVKGHIKSELELPEYHRLTLQNDDPANGSLLVNNRIDITDDEWQGDYFEEVPMTLEAIPLPGYRFSHWSGDLDSEIAKQRIDMKRNMTLRAHFITDDSYVQDLVQITFASVYPNPFDQEIKLHFKKTISKQLDLKLKTAQGHTICHLYKGSIVANQILSRSIDQYLASGLYFIEFSQNGHPIGQLSIIKN